MKVAVSGKGGAGKTTFAARLCRELARRRPRTLAVDCDPNPNLAESFGLDSSALERFSARGLRRAPNTLALAREPRVVEVVGGLWLLGGPPSDEPLGDAVARGIAGVLLAHRYDAVVTDLGAGPEFAEMAVGGALNRPACAWSSPVKAPARSSQHAGSRRRAAAVECPHGGSIRPASAPCDGLSTS